MNAKPLVSIIIPTYNRAHLIVETLDSIMAQTYTHWECIVVDDGSSDETDVFMKAYCDKDSRFKYFHRAIDRQKGANACRNMGLEKAIGEYIIFFDSDDLMTKDHIQVKLKPLLENDYDFSIAKTKFFNVEDNRLESYYKFDKFELTAHNYIVQNLNWLTYDICLKSNLAKSIRFNEKLHSGQEYNYFSKLVLKSTHAVFIEEYLTLRRKHEGSIRNNLEKTNTRDIGAFFSMWETYLEVKNNIASPTKKFLLGKCIKIIFTLNYFIIEDKSFFLKEIYYEYGILGLMRFFLMLFLRRFFNKGYSLRQTFQA